MVEKKEGYMVQVEAESYKDLEDLLSHIRYTKTLKLISVSEAV